MRIAMAAAMLLLTMHSYAANRVQVYVDNDLIVDGFLLQQAEYLATRMLGRIGVAVEWRAGKSPRKTGAGVEPIIVQLSSDTPENFHPGALGYAVVFPDSMGHVFVFADRVRPGGVPAVLAHEITHVLEGVIRHAETGVMKPKWTFADYKQMASGPLGFDPVDVNVVRYRLARR